ncbi:MAG: STAS domain-containing protein [bacterium]|jgi:anti-anti-sigma factor|nr:STAS domain-containing protein [bacterium]
MEHNEENNAAVSENWSRPASINVEEKDGKIAIFRPRGYLEYDSSYRFRNMIEKYVTEGFSSIIINLSELDFIDSLGTGVLITGFGKCEENNGKLVLAAPNEKMLYVIKVMHLDNVFTIYANEEEALAALK